MNPSKLCFRERCRGALHRAAIVALASALAFVPSAQACTSFLLRTSDGGVVYGRTMEFGFHLTSEAIVLPRQFAFSATGPDGKPGLVWSSKYGAVGLNAFGLPVLTDGMNEKGLAGGILYFPGYAGYANPVATDPAKALAPWEFLTWALTSFATVAEVKAALAGVAIIDVAQPNLGITPPFHYTLHDAGGASIVIEPVNGTLRVYDNPLGVMTNAPTFDWHLTNLKNYVKISPVNAEAITINGVTILRSDRAPACLGFPAIRRRRPASCARSATRSRPRSCRAVSRACGSPSISSTISTFRWVSSSRARTTTPRSNIPSGRASPSSTTKRYYVKTYDDQVLRGIDLMSFDLDAETVASALLEPNLPPPPLKFDKLQSRFGTR